ncbi:DUF4382 domain-containing protein [Geomonas sp. Red69]|uniref:DUF4382 domain-containing protein n=1 Tax=Geomonas diazotrophica TaxID=2843197 RepID=A0ABX8JP37_9BACT|nr:MULTISPECIES: DUF4382 domain-containing protein [Geomonas]MBU5636961.1 DUF4382 domain-containing protein [Geomonas diazotrophica]QWV98861.1 DUF4382 domain-containing protein [Geomonas nitrogeniifigens]QXE88008.1 DUF4382 domain-containing protein [Geomonas nitrogeniifigens]
MREKRSALRIMILFVCAVATTLLYLSGCGGGGSSAGKGTLKLAITDKQSDDFQNLVISVKEIRVVPAGHENAADDDPALPVLARFNPQEKVIDVMTLQFVQQALGELVLPAGTYRQIRLVLYPNPNGNQAPVNYLTLKSDPNTKIPLTTPSGQQSGLKILGPMEVKPGVINAVMIDFDPNTAVVKRGNTNEYNLKPTGIRLIQMADVLTQFGSIIGNVSSTLQNWSSATVSIKRRGSINDTTPIASGQIFAGYTSGKWQAPFSAFVPASEPGWGYKAFVNSNGFALYSSAAVPVVQGQARDLGEIVLVPQ